MAEEQSECQSDSSYEDEDVLTPCLILYRNTTHLIGHYGYMPRVYPIFRALRLRLGHPILHQIEMHAPFREDSYQSESKVRSRRHESASRQPDRQVGFQGCCSSRSAGKQNAPHFTHGCEAQGIQERPRVGCALHSYRKLEGPHICCPSHSSEKQDGSNVNCASYNPRNQERPHGYYAPHSPRRLARRIQTQRRVRKPARRAVSTRIANQKVTSRERETHSEEQRRIYNATEWDAQRLTELTAQWNVRLERSSPQRDARVHTGAQLEGFVARRGAQRRSVRAAQRPPGRAALRGAQRHSPSSEENSPEREALRGAQKSSVRVVHREPGRAALRGMQRPLRSEQLPACAALREAAERPSVRAAQRPPGRAILRGVRRQIDFRAQRGSRAARIHRNPNVPMDDESSIIRLAPQLVGGNPRHVRTHQLSPVLE